MRSYFYTKICRLRFPWPCVPKSLMGYISLGLRNLNPYLFCCPLSSSHDTKCFDPSLSQFHM